MRTLLLLGDRYRLGPIIGTGGMGAVHRAYDERFGREVAVKVVRSGADATERERLRREAQYLAGLDHPNLVAVYDAGADSTATGETVWFAMELVDGPDLRHVLRDGGPLSTADAARVLEAAAGALGTLHEAGVVHRDLKPANVLLTAHPSSGRWDVKLADLGIAQLMRGEQLTSTGQVIGTAAYLSPEQVSGGRVGPASDVYALGLLIIEALTGQVAFPGGPVESAAARLVRAPDVPRGIEPGWRTLLIDMTAREARDRPTIGEILRRTAPLQRSAVPFVPSEPTALLPRHVPAADALDDDAPTQAMSALEPHPSAHHVPGRVHETGWTPSLRPRRRPLRRRGTLLAAGALTVVAALAGGGAAMVGGGAEADATPRHSSGPTKAAATTPSPRASVTTAAESAPSDAAASPGATTSSAAPTSVTASSDAEQDAKAESKQESKAAKAAEKAEKAAEKTDGPARSVAHRQVASGLQRLQDRVEERLRERLTDR